MIGRLRRIKWTNCPAPIETVSPSPVTPSAIRFLFASIAPVATEGMRPCTELKLCERFMKYAGLFDEQPMPLNFATRSGCTPISYIASMMRSEIALCPQPAQSVVFPPRYSTTCSPMRLVFGVAGGVGVVTGVLVGVFPMLLALHHHEFVSHGIRVDGQSVDMANRAQTRRQFRFDVELEQASHLPVAVLLHHIHALVPLNEVVNLARKRIRPHPKIIRFQLVLFKQLIARFDDRPVRRAISDDADLRRSAARHFRTRNERPGSLELLVDPFHVAFEIVRTLAVLRLLIVAAAARKISRCGMIRAR